MPYSLEKIDSGVVPIENSTEGAVNSTLDFLIYSEELSIVSQLILPISQNLMIKEGVEKIEKIYSHPHALAQCIMYLNKNYNQAELVHVSSTAEAARLVSESNENCAAVSLDIAAQIYNLKIIGKSIQDINSNFTKFILVEKNKEFNPQKKPQNNSSFFNN